MPYTGAVNGAPDPAATAAARTDRSAMATAAAVFLIGAFILYWPALQAPFLFDDLYLVFDNRPILSLGNLPAMLHHNRPLVILSYAINYAWGGYAPLGYHAVQVALHGLNAWLVAVVFLALARRWGGAAGAAPATLWWALGAGAVFLANPLLSMAVVLVSARSELLCAGFYLLGLILYLRQRDHPAGIGWLGVTAAYLAAGLSKEMAVTFPAACLLVALLDGRTLRQVWREEQKLWLALAVVTAALLVKVLQFDWGETVGGGQLPFTRWEYFLTQITLVARQAGVFLLSLPGWLCADPDYPAVRSLLDPRLLASLAFWAAALAGLVWAWRRRRRLVALAGVMYPLAGAPTASVIPIADPLMEYRIYVPAVFLAMLIAGLAWPADASPQGDRRGRWRAWAGAAGLVLLLLGQAVLLQLRLPAYGSSLAFWTDTAAKAPDKPRPNYNLAVTNLRLGRLDDAVAGFRRVLALEPGNTDALLQLGDIARDRGDYAAATNRCCAVSPSPASSPTASPTWLSRPAGTTRRSPCWRSSPTCRRTRGTTSTSPSISPAPGNWTARRPCTARSWSWSPTTPWPGPIWATSISAAGARTRPPSTTGGRCRWNPTTTWRISTWRCSTPGSANSISRRPRCAPCSR